MRFLIVDDDAIIRRLLIGMLTPYGACTEACDGRAALGCFGPAFDATPIDVITLDLDMPNLNGMETLAAIRTIEARRGIPDALGVKIVIVTSCDDAEYLFTAFHRQCTAYLRKPITKSSVLSCLEGLGVIPWSGGARRR